MYSYKLFRKEKNATISRHKTKSQLTKHRINIVNSYLFFTNTNYNLFIKFLNHNLIFLNHKITSKLILEEVATSFTFSKWLIKYYKTSY
uniref:Ribosomal protein L20 n=1 Tax=Calliarthron tuberculosum TaxID=48942 RepID=A0A0F7C9W1_CALTB|nr:ribosomal protein L20 [Calliarthron tuberculosum]AKG26254.1 ribosomal protein L20 [Calliarthron tuberculosum]